MPWGMLTSSVLLPMRICDTKLGFEGPKESCDTVAGAILRHESQLCFLVSCPMIPCAHVDRPAMVRNGLLLSPCICACMTPYTCHTYNTYMIGFSGDLMLVVLLRSLRPLLERRPSPAHAVQRTARNG